MLVHQMATVVVVVVVLTPFSNSVILAIVISISIRVFLVLSTLDQ